MNNKLLIGIGVVAIIAIGTFVLTKTSGKAPELSAGPKKLQVTASFYPLYYFASQIGKEKADVKNITPAAAEPHDYDPSTQNIARIETSDMLILNGSVEPWGDKIQDNLKGSKVLIVIAAQGLLNRQLTEEGKILVDPHVWLDPVLAKKEAHIIANGFIKIDPQSKVFYQDNEKALDVKLDQLDSDYKNGLKSCQQKNIITSHAAFAYLGA